LHARARMMSLARVPVPPPHTSSHHLLSPIVPPFHPASGLPSMLLGIVDLRPRVGCQCEAKGEREERHRPPSVGVDEPSRGSFQYVTGGRDEPLRDRLSTPGDLASIDFHYGRNGNGQKRTTDTHARTPHSTPQGPCGSTSTMPHRTSVCWSCECAR